MHPLVNTAIKAARAAAKEVVRLFSRPDYLEIGEKAHGEPVTNADLKAEQTIFRIIHQHYPEHGLVGEEQGTIEGQSPFSWIIDPIDGTRNFVHGIAHFATSIAITYQNRVEHALIYNPISDELFVASEGEGAFLNNRRIRCTQDLEPSKALVALLIGRRELQDDPDRLDKLDQLNAAVYKTFASVRHSGSAALDCAFVAAGRLDGAALLNLSSWDLAAGALLIKEAGGVAVEPYLDQNYQEQRCLVGGGFAAAQALQKLVKEHS